MSTTDRDPGDEALNREVRAIWEENAAFWDERMGDGNAFQDQLIGPATDRLLAVRPDELILDLACGNGVSTRRLAAQGARVVACDFSPTMIERARARSAAHAGRIEYRVVDATDAEQLLALGAGRFDGAVCNMAIMDMATIEPLLAALRDLLKPGGRFVFSLIHPCFNSAPHTRLVEEEDRDGVLTATYAVKVTGYVRPVTYRGLGMVGQPAPHYYFHRPLGLLLTSCFRAGFVLDGIEEPAFAEETTGRRASNWEHFKLTWEHFKEISPVLVARLRPAAPPAP